MCMELLASRQLGTVLTSIFNIKFKLRLTLWAQSKARKITKKMQNLKIVHSTKEVTNSESTERIDFFSVHLLGEKQQKDFSFLKSKCSAKADSVNYSCCLPKQGEKPHNRTLIPIGSV